MGEKADFEHLSEHDKYYLAQKSRKEYFAYAIVVGVFASTMLWTFSDIMVDDNPNFWLYHNFEISAGSIILFCIGISRILPSKRVKKAKEALAGDLVSLDVPKWIGGRILTMVHPEDVEIGEQIHLDYSEDLDPEDVFYMFNAECTSVGSHTEYWTMPTHTPGGSGNYGSESYGGSGYGGSGYGGYGTSESHGSTTYYSAKLKLKSTSTIFSSTKYKRWINVGDTVDLLVQINSIKSGETCSVTILKTLNRQQADSDEL